MIWKYYRTKVLQVVYKAWGQLSLDRVTVINSDGFTLCLIKCNYYSYYYYYVNSYDLSFLLILQLNAPVECLS